MQLELLNDQGQASSKFDAPETVFGRAYNEDLIHQIVVAYQANARQGTRAQKDREQVHHSTKKPFKQKGTGRARAGMTSSPTVGLDDGISDIDAMSTNSSSGSGVGSFSPFFKDFDLWNRLSSSDI